MDWSEIIAGLIVASAIGAGTWATRTFVRGIKTYLAEEIKTQLMPNGGSSLADRVTAVESAVGELTAVLRETECLPGCPQRNACTHTLTVEDKPRRRFFG